MEEKRCRNNPSKKAPDTASSPKKEESVKIKKIETHVISLVERIFISKYLFISTYISF